MSTEKDWFTTATGRRITVIEIAKHLGVNRNTATTRLQEGLTSDEIITVARKLHINPVLALEELEKITVDEIFDYVDSDGTLAATASKEELVFYLAESSLTIEQKRRLLERVQLHRSEEDQLAARREAKKSNNPAPTVRNRRQDIAMPDDAVADSSPEVGGTLDDYDL